MPTKNSQKKVAVVIGATGNLGTAIVEALTKAGYEVDKTWTGEKRPDASLAASYKNLPKRIDMAVYVAGINLVKPVQEITEEEWDKVMGVNLKGAFFFAQGAFEGLKAARGTLVTISSMNARYPYPNRSAYTTSKAGIEGLTRELAIEWGQYGISTHSIRLGPLTKLMKTTTTNAIALEAARKRMLQQTLIPPEAIGEYIVDIGKGTAKWITGSVVDFEGGFTLNAYPL